MPKLIGEKMGRTTLPIRTPIIQEIDRIVKEFPEYGWNRQTFSEEALREKIMRVLELQAAYRARP
jgi:hypothetical protein